MFEVGDIVGVHVTQLKFGVNARYGWSGEGSILEAYKEKNEALREIIESWGFRKAHAVEAFYNNEGDLVVKHGNRRTFVAKWIYADDEDAVIAWDLPAGEIWVQIVERPASIVELMSEQVADNEQLAATKLDQIMVVDARVKELLASGDAKTPATAVKIVAKQDFKQKAQKLVAKGACIDLDAAYKSLKKEMAQYEVSLKRDLKIMALPSPVLAWLQESCLESCEIRISFGRINALLTEYGESTALLLSEAIKEITLEHRDEYAQGSLVSNRWLNHLATKLGLQGQKPEQTQQPTNKIETPAINPVLPKTKQTQERQKQILHEQSPRQYRKDRDQIPNNIAAILQGGFGAHLADAVTIEERSPGVYTATIDLPNKDLAKRFQSLISAISESFAISSISNNQENSQVLLIDNQENNDELTQELPDIKEIINNINLDGFEY